MWLCAFGIIIKVLRYNFVNAFCVILEMLLVLQLHLINFALGLIFFFDIS